MAKIETLFVTRLYRAEINGKSGNALVEDLAQSCLYLANLTPIERFG